MRLFQRAGKNCDLHLFAETAADAGYRICIVDCADELNLASANALLKVMEEPPPLCPNSRSGPSPTSSGPRPNGLLPTIVFVKPRRISVLFIGEPPRDFEVFA